MTRTEAPRPVTTAQVVRPDVPVRLGVAGLGFSYRPAGEELFGGTSHTFEPSAVTAVTGPSGRGKSTLLYVLGLMLAPTRGEVLLDATPISRGTDAARAAVRASTFGFVFQDASLDPTRRVLDCVTEPALYAGIRRGDAVARARELLDELGVALRLDHRPGEISGGQAQRVAIARALINDPQIVLADEPTGNLDHGNAEVVLDILGRAAHDGRTVVVATHDPFVLERADRVLAL